MHPSVGKEYILSLMMFDEIDLIRQDIGPDRITLIHLLFRFFYLLVPRWIGVSPRYSSPFMRCLLFLWLITLCLMCANLIIFWSNRKCQCLQE